MPGSQNGCLALQSGRSSYGNAATRMLLSRWDCPALDQLWWNGDEVTPAYEVPQEGPFRLAPGRKWNGEPEPRLAAHGARGDRLTPTDAH
jgi:hypothetical protein